MDSFIEDLTLEGYFDNIHKLPIMLGIDRRVHGAYYTDKYIVNYILNNLNIKKQSYILDPSCGCGSFIFPLCLRSDNGTKGNLNQIYGIDIDKKAIDYTVETIFKLSGSTDKKEIQSHFINDDFIFDSRTKYDNKYSFANIVESGGFHFIIGNPPFNPEIQKNKSLMLENKEHLDIAKRSKNVPIYFILRGLEILRKDGVLAFVLPKTLLYVGKYKEFRQYLLQNFTIMKIVEIGIKFKDVRGEQIILFIKNKKPGKNSSIEFSSISVRPPYQSEAPFRVRQNNFTSLNVLPTMPNKESYLIVRGLTNKYRKLINPSEIFVSRGVSLGKNVIKTIPYNIGNDIPKNAFIRGRGISKLTLKELTIVDDSNLPKSKILDLMRPKIVAQNIYSTESGLISYLDVHGIPTTETVSNIFIDNQEKMEYVFALLNSKLMNFYMSQFIFSGSRLTMHVDGYYLRQLPLIWDTNKEETVRLIKLGRDIASNQISNCKSYLQEIDKIVYKLYGIGEDQRKVIESIMNKTLSKKSIW